MLSVSYTRRKGQDFFMSIFENTVMIKKRPSYGQLFAQYLLIALTILSALGTILFSPLGLFVPTVLFAVFAYFMHGSCDMEYEYTYIEGELDIDKIKAKRKRKKVAKIDLDELILIAPQGSGELNQYRGNSDVNKLKAVSGRPDAKIYDVVYRDNNTIHIISFEPDEKMIDTLHKRYMRKVIL